MTSDIELLRLEMATLWESDAYGRLTSHPMIAFAFAENQESVRCSPAMSDDLRQRLESQSFDSKGVEKGGSKLLERMHELLPSLGPMRISGGRSYVFGDASLVSSPKFATLKIVTSDLAVPSTLRAARPQGWWEPQEWDDLLAGRLGPWAIGIEERLVVAVCHTPVCSLVAAEAGVWTHPEARGQGYAGGVTTAWANVARCQLRTLFYSTAIENAASQAVARKLGLRPIGQIWQISPIHRPSVPD